MVRKQKNVMLNLVQHLTESRTRETLKRVQGDIQGLLPDYQKLSEPTAPRVGLLPDNAVLQCLLPVFHNHIRPG